MFKFNTDTIEKLKAVDKRYWAMGLAACVVAVSLFFVCANQITLTDEALSKKEITFNVPPGTPAARIPAILEKEGVEVNDFYFKLSLRLSGAHKNLHAGFYRVYPDDTVGSITERLSKGEAYLFSWRIPDGSTYWEVRKSLNALDGIKHDSRDMTAEALLFAIGAKETHLEGLFAPDTYNFHANVSEVRPSGAEVDHALGFSNGRSDFMAEYGSLSESVLNEFANFELYLPTQSPNVNVGTLNFGRANAETCGCLSAFVRENHLARLQAILDGSGDSLGLFDRIVQRLASSLTAVKMLSLRRDEWVGRASSLYTESYSLNMIDQRPMFDALRQMMRVEIARRMREETIRAIDMLYAEAEKTEEAFARLRNDVALGTSVNEEGTHFNLTGFYGRCTDAYLSDQARLNVLFATIDRIGNGEGEMFAILRDHALVPLFDLDYGGRQVFKLGFMEEQVTRRAEGKAPETAQLVVGSELVDDMANYIGYNSLIPMADQECEAYLIHREMSGGAEADQLFTYLDRLGKPTGTIRVFMNAGPQDCATSLWLYPLKSDHLRA